jgi:hypothetical protein
MDEPVMGDKKQQGHGNCHGHEVCLYFIPEMIYFQNGVLSTPVVCIEP